MKSQDAEQISISFRFYRKTTPTRKFSKFSPERIHRDTDRRIVFKFREIWPTENRAVKSCVAYTWRKKNKISPDSPALAMLHRSRPKSARASPPPKNVLTAFQILSKSVYFRWSYSLTHEHRQSALKVNPRLGWRIALLGSSRIVEKDNRYFCVFNSYTMFTRCDRRGDDRGDRSRDRSPRRSHRVNIYLPRTRSNGLKLYNVHCNIDARKAFFTNHVVDVWKFLPAAVVIIDTRPSMLLNAV